MEKEVCFKLQQRVQLLESQIKETQLLLDKENAKYHSACRQQEVSVNMNSCHKLQDYDCLGCQKKHN